MAFAKKTAKLTISNPNFQTVKFKIVGTSSLMVHHFGEKARKQIIAKQTSENKVAGKRPPKDYKAEFESARYRAAGAGWDGFYAGAIRNAMIAAARYVDGLQMTKSKGLFFIRAEGRDRTDGTPLVRIRGCKAVHDTRPARNDDGGADIRNRPRFDNWHAEVSIDFDADAMSAQDIANLLQRAGTQVGICDGRPGSPNSNGMGFGTFTVAGSKTTRKSKS